MAVVDEHRHDSSLPCCPTVHTQCSEYIVYETVANSHGLIDFLPLPPLPRCGLTKRGLTPGSSELDSWQILVPRYIGLRQQYHCCVQDFIHR